MTLNIIKRVIKLLFCYFCFSKILEEIKLPISFVPITEVSLDHGNVDESVFSFDYPKLTHQPKGGMGFRTMNSKAAQPAYLYILDNRN